MKEEKKMRRSAAWKEAGMFSTKTAAGLDFLGAEAVAILDQKFNK